MNEANALARVAAWLHPISDASPAGEDARYDPLHEQIRAEAAKLDAPAGGAPNWAKLAKDAEQLTSARSKDLLIESYAAYALYQTEGLGGLAAGLFLLGESMDRFWEAMHPTSKRIRARVNAINWLVERLDVTLPNTPVGAPEAEAVMALDAASKRLRAVVSEKFVEEAPALRPLQDAIERLRISLPVAAAAPAPAAAAPAAAAPPAAAPAAAPAATAPAPVAAAAPESAPAAPVVDLAAELAQLAAPYIQPIPGASPAGIDAKYDPEHEELRNEVTSLDLPTGGNIDWARAVPKAQNLLATKSKDLLIASYLAFGLHETRGLLGLAAGLEAITQICELYWVDCFPSVKRLRGRGNAVGWLLERIEKPLPNVKLTANDRHAVELLEAAAKRLAGVVRDKFEDAAPPTRPLLDVIQRLKMSVPEPPKAAAPPPPTPTVAAPQPAATPTATTPGAKPAEKPLAPMGDAPAPLADAKELDKYRGTVAKQMLATAKTVRDAAPADPGSFQFVRVALIIAARLPIANGNETELPPPPATQVAEFEALLRAGNWERLLQFCELAITGKWMWLDLHRGSALALGNLGASHAAARNVVLAGAAYLLRMFPPLLGFTFKGGQPFASDVTKAWIGEEVLPSGGGGGGEKSEGYEQLGEARSLLATGKLEDALGILEGLRGSAKSGRTRFRARLAMGQSLATGNTLTLAEALFDALLHEIDAIGLEAWEPELAAECYRSHLACLKQLKKGNDPVVSQQTALVYRRLCRVDPLAAMKAGA